VELAKKLVHGGAVIFTLAVSLGMGAALGLLHIPFRAEPSGILRFVRRTTPSIHSWKTVHLLSTSCPCSQAVSTHLIHRGIFAGAQEYVVLAGNDPALARNLTQAGYQVQSRSPEEIANQFQVPGAPWFILVSPTQKIVYAGGYAADRNARGGYQDQQIWENRAAKLAYTALPVYGCALSRRLQKRTDPFGLKY
jgi:hypothetical protein